jgi:hypothetical protein
MRLARDVEPDAGSVRLVDESPAAMQIFNAAFVSHQLPHLLGRTAGRKHPIPARLPNEHRLGRLRAGRDIADGIHSTSADAKVD